MYGVAGQLSAARRTAPEDANDNDIIRVGYRAWEEERDVREIWDEVMADA